MGIISLIPLLVLLVLVIVTKRVIPSMIIAVAITFIISDGTNFMFGFIDGWYEILYVGAYPWLVIVLPLFGALIQVLIRSGGTHGFRTMAERYIKSKKSSLVFTWILGVILCIDDYINDLAIGPTVRTITDEQKVPREGIGFIIIAMGVPVTALVPISAMSSYTYGIMLDEGVSAADSNMIAEILKVIPFLFYPFAIILVALLFSLGILPKMFGMKKAFEKAEAGELELHTGQHEEEEQEAGKIIDFLVPVLVLIGVMIWVAELIVAVCAALLVAFLMYIPRKRMSVDTFFEEFITGLCSMVETLVVIGLAFIMVFGLTNMGFDVFVIETVTPYLTGSMIPALVFAVALIIVYLGIDYWAVILLLGPIAVPLAEQFGVSSYFAMAAVVAGSIGGATMCMYGEQMLMCSQSVQKTSVQLGIAVFPYTVIAAILAFLAYVVVGFVVY